MPRPIITLLTDFGTRDSYVAQMKGVILGINPDVEVIDITHEIRPQAILQGALCLDATFDAFPAGTIHIVIIDPGVGSARRGIAAELGGRRYVGPDNGLLSVVAKRYPPNRVHALTEPRFHRLPVSPTFHGRDIFSPVAAHWSLGHELSEFGDSMNAALAELRLPKVETAEREVRGEVIDVDHFGNLTTNIMASDLPTNCPGALITSVADHDLVGLSRYYSEHVPGALLTLIGSSGRLEIAQNTGSAAVTLQVTVGAAVRVWW